MTRISIHCHYTKNLWSNKWKVKVIDMTVRERFNTLTSVELAAELKRIKEMRDWCSELDDDRDMAAYLDSEYGNNEYSDYED